MMTQHDKQQQHGFFLLMASAPENSINFLVSKQPLVSIRRQDTNQLYCNGCMRLYQHMRGSKRGHIVAGACRRNITSVDNVGFAALWVKDGVGRLWRTVGVLQFCRPCTEAF